MIAQPLWWEKAKWKIQIEIFPQARYLRWRIMIKYRFKLMEMVFSRHISSWYVDWYSYLVAIFFFCQHPWQPVIGGLVSSLIQGSCSDKICILSRMDWVYQHSLNNSWLWILAECQHMIQKLKWHRIGNL